MEPQREFERLVEIMARLRGEGGCPWDREQTHASIRPYCIEEAYEVVQAIDDGDVGGLREELGDLLLQVVFHAQMAREAGAFAIVDVLRTLNDKLVRRHPHVFAKTAENELQDSAQVLEKWAELKKKEGRKSTLDGVPKALPALLCATRMGEKAAGVGFDWKSSGDVAAKVAEELGEIAAARDADHKEEEFGDLLFALTQWARHEKIDAETALRRANAKFERRFRWMEQESVADATELKRLAPDALEASWARAKAAVG